MKYANKKLNKIEGYKGVVEDIDLALYKGAYIIDSAYFMKEGAGFDKPFMAAGKVTVMIDWNALFQHGQLVAYVMIDDAELNFMIAPSESDSTGKVQQFGKGVNWLQHFKKMSPLKFNKLEVTNSRINYIDQTKSPHIDGYIRDIRISGSNLQNVQKLDDPLPGELKLSGIAKGGGSLDLSINLNMHKKPMDLNYDLVLKEVDIVDWNDLMKSTTGLDFESGIFSCFSEMKVKDGKIDGYVKPIIENLSIYSENKEQGSFLDKAWEAIAGGIVEIFENQKKEQFASRVPISGTLDDTEINAVRAIWNIFRNAFVEAFSKELEHDVSVSE